MPTAAPASRTSRRSSTSPSTTKIIPCKGSSQVSHLKMSKFDLPSTPPPFSPFSQPIPNFVSPSPQTMVVSGHTERKHEEGDPSLRLGSSDSSKKIEGAKGKDSEVKMKDSKDTKDSKDKSSGPKYWLSERSFGEFSRVFNFPNNIDQDKVKAKFNQGILDILVPKAEKTGARKIEIQG